VSSPAPWSYAVHRAPLCACAPLCLCACYDLLLATYCWLLEEKFGHFTPRYKSGLFFCRRAFTTFFILPHFTCIDELDGQPHVPTLPHPPCPCRATSYERTRAQCPSRACATPASPTPPQGNTHACALCAHDARSRSLWLALALELLTVPRSGMPSARLAFNLLQDVRLLFRAGFCAHINSLYSLFFLLNHLHYFVWAPTNHPFILHRPHDCAIDCFHPTPFIANINIFHTILVMAISCKGQGQLRER